MVMAKGLRRGIVLVLGLAAAALPACAADAGDAADAEDSIDLDDDSGFAEGEVLGSTADGAEQALVTNGCHFHVRTRLTKQGWVAGSAEWWCNPRRTITVGVCMDRFEDGRWRSFACTGAKRKPAWNDAVVDLWTPQQDGSPWYKDPGTYRVRARAVGYGTVTSEIVEVPRN
jgi:hypothetical protein